MENPGPDVSRPIGHRPLRNRAIGSLSARMNQLIEPRHWRITSRRSGEDGALHASRIVTIADRAGEDGQPAFRDLSI